MREIVTLARSAMATIHADRHWWRKIGIGGALMLTIFGFPFAAGLVVEHIDNSRKGFAVPLPPWFDWSTRYLLGMFALLIDLVFFGLPLMVIALISGCILLFVVIGGAPGVVGEAATEAAWIALAAQVLAGLSFLFFFLSSASPVGRLIFVTDGSIEDALSGRPLREAFKAGRRGIYLRARLASLAGYLPFLGVIAVFFGLTSQSLPGQFWIGVGLLWLGCCSLLYGQLFTGQAYVQAERRAGIMR